MENTHKTISTFHRIDEKLNKRKISSFSHLFRFIGLWFGFTGLYASSTVCPFCGQQGCPVGIASAGTIGAFFALCFQNWKRFFSFIKKRIKRKKEF